VGAGTKRLSGGQTPPPTLSSRGGGGGEQRIDSDPPEYPPGHVPGGEKRGSTWGTAADREEKGEREQTSPGVNYNGPIKNKRFRGHNEKPMAALDKEERQRLKRMLYLMPTGRHDEWLANTNDRTEGLFKHPLQDWC